MTITVADVRAAGTNLSILKRPIYEPLNAPSLLNNFLDRFGDNYNITFNSSLYKFLLGLAGDGGSGSLSRGLLNAKLASLLQSTHFTDLDLLYGNPIGLSRLPSETYSQNPFQDSLTINEWDLIFAADASYRHRCLMWMRAIICGGSPEGMELAGFAASGIECDVVEQYKYLDDNTLSNLGKTNSRNEFIIVPRAPSIDAATERSIVHQIDALRPTNTLPTVATQPATRTALTVKSIVASTESFYVKRLVTGRSDVIWPATDPSKGLWITTSEEEAPTFAFMQIQESLTFLPISNITASSEHIGIFNKTQRSLFPILANNTDPLFIFSASRSYVPSYIPLQVSTPWVTR